MAKIRAVLDTNVLVGKYRLALLASAGLGIYELILSPYIMTEVKYVLTGGFKVPEDFATRFIAELEAIVTVVDERDVCGGNYSCDFHSNYSR